MIPPKSKKTSALTMSIGIQSAAPRASQSCPVESPVTAERPRITKTLPVANRIVGSEPWNG